MRIGIDVSQIVFEGTGVARYVREMVKTLVSSDKKNDYILIGASWGRRRLLDVFFDRIRVINPRVKCILLPVPLKIMEFVWNRLHIFPVEWLTGNLDVFWSSDWTQPPLLKARGITTVHDLSFLKYPAESDAEIRKVHKRRLTRVKQECTAVLCDSDSTRKDLVKILKFDRARLHVVYPGY